MPNVRQLVKFLGHPLGTALEIGLIVAEILGSILLPEYLEEEDEEDD